MFFLPPIACWKGCDSRRLGHEVVKHKTCLRMSGTFNCATDKWNEVCSCIAEAENQRTLDLDWNRVKQISRTGATSPQSRRYLIWETSLPVKGTCWDYRKFRYQIGTKYNEINFSNLQCRPLTSHNNHRKLWSMRKVGCREAFRCSGLDAQREPNCSPEFIHCLHSWNNRCILVTYRKIQNSWTSVFFYKAELGIFTLQVTNGFPLPYFLQLTPLKFTSKVPGTHKSTQGRISSLMWSEFKPDAWEKSNSFGSQCLEA